MAIKGKNPRKEGF